LAGEGRLLPYMVDAYRDRPLADSLVFYHPDGKKAKNMAKRLGLDGAVSDIHSFRNEVDAVEVFDPPGGRVELVERLLKAGKYVSVQKPFAENMEDARVMARAAKSSGAFLRVNDYALFYEPYVRLKKMIRSMEIGEVCAIRFHSNLAGGGGWGPLPEYLKDGRVLFHPAFDRFALAIDLLGDVDSVIAGINPMRPRKGGQGVVGFKYKAPGCYGHFDLTYAPQTAIRTDGLPCDDTIEVAGTDGIIWARHFHGKMTEEPSIEVRRGKKCYSMGIGSGMRTEWTDSLRASAGHFLKSISRSRRPRLSGRDAMKALKFLAAAQEASDMRSEVKL
ncbi:MAG: Gfo/Idh/MocA family oxidoreductase, partial [Candidatus Omnitrophota bacterium]